MNAWMDMDECLKYLLGKEKDDTKIDFFLRAFFYVNYLSTTSVTVNIFLFIE